MNLRRFRTVKPAALELPTNAFEQSEWPEVAPPTRVLPLPAPPRGLPDPPIFAAVMSEKWWPTTESGHPAWKHALEAQFTMAFALDELTDVDRAECAAKAKGTAIIGLVA